MLINEPKKKGIYIYININTKRETHYSLIFYFIQKLKDMMYLLCTIS